MNYVRCCFESAMNLREHILKGSIETDEIGSQVFDFLTSISR